jgi:hypothetical protein
MLSICHGSAVRGAVGETETREGHDRRNSPKLAIRNWPGFVLCELRAILISRVGD